MMIPLMHSYGVRVYGILETSVHGATLCVVTHLLLLLLHEHANAQIEPWALLLPSPLPCRERLTSPRLY